MKMDSIKKGLPVWVQLNQTKIAGIIIDYAFSSEGNYLQCMVELELPNPLHPGQVLRQIYPKPIQSYKLSKRTPTEENSHILAETGVLQIGKPPRTHTIYTIGYGIEAVEQHAAHSQIETFLKRPDPGIIIDIRITPHSNLPGWSLSELQQDYSTRYMHIVELGNINHHSSQPIELVDEQSGLDQATAWLEQFDICLLCGCYRARKCHRSYVAEKLAARTQAPVCHLLQALNSPIGPEERPAPKPPRKRSKQVQVPSDQLALWRPDEL